MDMFMDKLAQKLTAQEMIKANMAADAEEMSRLKEKSKEYTECLEQVQKLVEEGVSKLEAAKVDGGEIDRLVSESIDKISQLQQNTDVLDALEELKQQLNEKLEASNENVHKECVKVYRNVQAAVTEENNKQTESIKEAVDAALGAAVKGFRGKLNAILVLSIISLAAALSGIALYVLNVLNIKFF